MFKRLLIALCFSLLLTKTARAEPEDDWLGQDKLLHFSFSALIASGGYGISSLWLDARSERALLGGGMALGAGVSKELYDLAGYGHPSWKDLAWDALGSIVGVAIAWAIDLSLSKPSSKPSEHRTTSVEASNLSQAPARGRAGDYSCSSSSGLCWHF